MIIPFRSATQPPLERQTLTPDRRYCVHDVDGVHHGYEGIDDVFGFYAHVKYVTLQDDFPDLSREDIRLIGLKSYQETGDGLIGFVNAAIQYGVIKPERADLFREGLFRGFHKQKFEIVQERGYDLLIPQPRTIQLMKDISAHFTHGILTQGCFPNWVKPVLESRGMLSFFEIHACLDFHDVGYETKKLSTKPLQIALDALGARPEETIFIEDSIDNLVMAKALDPRILCVLISDEPLKPQHEPYVDIQMPSLVTFLEYARNQLCKPAPLLGLDLQ